MNATARRWVVRLTAAAEGDFREIVRWTAERYGSTQARGYARTISSALRELTTGPLVAGARERDDIGAGIRLLHVARHGRHGRHLVMYRVAEGATMSTVEVLRILHDSMDLQRHLPG